MNGYQDIAHAILARIHSGELRPGAQLLPVRAQAQAAGVALATAVRAYAWLEQQGLVVAERGRGTFVRDQGACRNDALVQTAGATPAIDLSFNSPTVAGQEEMLRQGLRNLASAGDIASLLGSVPQGGTLHQRALAARFLQQRGLTPDAAQVLLVNGAQHGITVALAACCQPGDAIAVDALTYPGLRAAAQAQRIDLLPVPLDAAGGPDLAALERLCARARVRAYYCMPTIHNPLGWVMPLAQRQALVQIARRCGLTLIEDAAYAFLADPAPPPLYALAPDCTIYVSSLSKSVAAGMRIGFVVAPAGMSDALARQIRVSIWNPSSVAMALACQWMESGEILALEQAKRHDARQRQTLAREVLEGCTIRAHPAAYFIWLELADSLRAEDTAARLARQGVTVTTAAAFAVGPQRPQALRLALGSVPLASLRAALEQVRREVLW